MTALREQVTIGWPEKVKQVPSLVRPYWSMHHHIGVENGLIFEGQWLIIPKSQQEGLLKRIQCGHQGIRKCELRAKKAVYCMTAGGTSPTTLL